MDGATDQIAIIWAFVPDEGASLYTDDTSHLTFGWWLDKDAGGNPANVRLVSDAVGLGLDRTDESTAGSALRGSATYKGAAAGKYAMASATADTYEGGHFTAMATLVVDFDADLLPTGADGLAEAGNDRNGIALSGMIDNFMTGDTSRPDWMVKLMADNDINTAGMQPLMTLVDDADNLTAGRGMMTEWSTGAAAKGTGNWTATWSDGRTGEDITDAVTNTAHPMAVRGTFGASIGAAARLEGAFGANKVMDE